jgi:SRSO17 transposase
MEPMGRALAGVHPKAVRALHAFMSAGAWAEEARLSQPWQEVETDVGEDDGVLLVDGSDLPMQVGHSAGVKRQSGGELGQRANGQAGVFVGSASPHGDTLLARRL